jgi:hypothetical protein
MNWDGELPCVSVGGIPVEKLFFGQDVDTCMYICLVDKLAGWNRQLCFERISPRNERGKK